MEYMCNFESRQCKHANAQMGDGAKALIKGECQQEDVPD
jgi:hypothetical protein